MLVIKTLEVTPFQQNTNILIDDEAKEAIVVDPGGDLEAIVRAVEHEALTVRYVVLTHAHLDHGGAVAPLLEHLRKAGNSSVELAAHPDETELRATLANQSLLFGLTEGEFKNVPEPDLLTHDGTMLQFGSLQCQVRHVPGHSPGHIVLYFEQVAYLCQGVLGNGQVVEREKGETPVLIAGDTLFAGSIGRTDLPGGDHETLIRSIKEKIFALPDETIVFSGHGPTTSVGQEKMTNPFLRAI